MPDRLCPVGLGVLTGEISPGMVDEIIELAGCREKRRRLLRKIFTKLGIGSRRELPAALAQLGQDRQTAQPEGPQ